MTIYERIKKRRKELNLSADDVANALGVSRATVYRYESSYIEKLPASSLEPLAKILKCSPAYLMGWDDTDSQTLNFIYSGENVDLLIDVQKKAHDQTFINSLKKYMDLIDSDRKSIDNIIDYLHTKNKRETD